MPYRRFARVPVPRHVEGVYEDIIPIAVEEYCGDLYIVLRYWNSHRYIYYCTWVACAYYLEFD